MAQNRNFKAVLKGINSYVTKNISEGEASRPPAVTSSKAAQPSSIEQQYVPPGIDMDQLSSSEQQRLRQRGVIKKITKKPLAERIQPKWKHDKFQEIIKKQKEAVIVKHHPTRIVFTSKDAISTEEVWNLLKDERIFIREVKIDKQRAKVGFANLTAAERALEIIKKTGKYNQVGLDVEQQNVKEQPTITKKSSIFDRIK